MLHSGRIAQPPPLANGLFEGVASYEEVRKDNDELLRQLQSIQTCISIWSLLPSSSTHRDALIRASSHIRVETTTTIEALIHRMTIDITTCNVFSDDNLPPEGSNYTHPLYISVGCSSYSVPSILMNNGSALNVYTLATVIDFGFATLGFDSMKNKKKGKRGNKILGVQR